MGTTRRATASAAFILRAAAIVLAALSARLSVAGEDEQAKLWCQEEQQEAEEKAAADDAGKLLWARFKGKLYVFRAGDERPKDAAPDAIGNFVLASGQSYYLKVRDPDLRRRVQEEQEGTPLTIVACPVNKGKYLVLGHVEEDD